MNHSLLYQIAEDVAAGETRVSVLFEHRGIPADEAARIIESQEFRRAVQLAREFREGGNQVDYIRERARAAAVEIIDPILAIAKSGNMDPKARVAAGKLLTEMADVGPKPQAAQPGQIASITIKLGNETEVIDAHPIRTLPEEDE